MGSNQATITYIEEWEIHIEKIDAWTQKFTTEPFRGAGEEAS